MATWDALRDAMTDFGLHELPALRQKAAEWDRSRPVYDALMHLYNVVNHDGTEWRDRPEVRKALADVFASLCRSNGQRVFICGQYHVYDALQHGQRCPFCAATAEGEGA